MILTNDKLTVLLAAVNQVKIWHWQTRNPDHETLGELYDAMSDLIDRFVEVALGNQGTRELPLPLVVRAQKYADLTTTNHDLKAIRTYLQTELLKGLPEETTELAQIRDDMLEAVNKAIYKLLR